MINEKVTNNVEENEFSAKTSKKLNEKVEIFDFKITPKEIEIPIRLNGEDVKIYKVSGGRHKSIAILNLFEQFDSPLDKAMGSIEETTKALEKIEQNGQFSQFLQQLITILIDSEELQAIILENENFEHTFEVLKYIMVNL